MGRKLEICEEKELFSRNGKEWRNDRRSKGRKNYGYVRWKDKERKYIEWRLNKGEVEWGKIYDRKWSGSRRIKKVRKK